MIRIFQHGVDMDVNKMYPTISFPVSRGTPMISPFIRWNHSDDYEVPIYDPFVRSNKRNITINLRDSKYSFMQGHKIHSKNFEINLSYF